MHLQLPLFLGMERNGTPNPTKILYKVVAVSICDSAHFRTYAEVVLAQILIVEALTRPTATRNVTLVIPTVGTHVPAAYSNVSANTSGCFS